MTPEFSAFAARVRECMISEGRIPRGPCLRIQNSDLKNRDQHEDSRSSPLRSEGCFNTLALELFALQFAHDTPYRRLCEARRHTPDTVEHWTQIPAVPASAFKELELSCLPVEERATVFYSSGTTEQRPSRHFHSVESLEIYEASLWPWFARHVVPDLRFTIYDLRSNRQRSDRKERPTIGHWPSVIILTPPSAVAPHSSLVHMFETVRRSLAAPASSFVGKLAADDTWTLDFDAASTALREAMENNLPLVCLGTAFSFVHLLDDLAERNLGLVLPPGSRLMETGGYKGRSRSLPKTELDALISERLGITPAQIVSEYGMSELSSQAYDIEARSANCEVRGVNRVFHFPPWARAQIISPETGREVAEGETGLLRIRDLANVFSVMAIQTEDLAVRRGDGFELTGRAELAEPRGCSLMTHDS